MKRYEGRRAFLEEIETETIQDMKEKFGADVGLGFYVRKYGDLNDFLRDEEHEGVPTRIIELELWFDNKAKIDAHTVKEYVKKMYYAWFHKHTCGCPYDCCGHTFTVNFYIMEKYRYVGGEEDMYEFVILQENGINY